MIFLFILLGVIFFGVLASAVIYYLTDSKWFCRNLNWHKPENIKFDGITLVGKCKVCQEKILQDSNGDWFQM